MHERCVALSGFIGLDFQFYYLFCFHLRFPFKELHASIQIIFKLRDALFSRFLITSAFPNKEALLERSE